MALKQSIAASGFLFIDSQVLMLKRALHETSDAGAWEPPGGQVEDGEDPEAAVVREFQEETGLLTTVKNISWAHSVVFPKADPKNHVIRIDYVVELQPGQDIKNIELTEDHEDWQLVGLGELKNIKPIWERNIDAANRAFARR